MSDTDMTPEARAETEREARRNGWQGREEFKGRPEEFVDASEYLERARTFVPFLKQERGRLQGELKSRDEQIAALSGNVRALSATVEALNESREEDLKEARAAERAEIEARLAQATEDSDAKGIAKATSDLVAHDTETAAAAKVEKKPAVSADQQINPALKAEIDGWMQEHQEYLNDVRLGSLTNAIGAEMRAKGDKRTGRVFLDDALNEALKTLGREPSRQGDSKAAGGNGGGGRGDASGEGAKTYADLPAEAKAACDKQAQRLVGPNRAHKTIESWRRSYVQQYYGDQK